MPIDGFSSAMPSTRSRRRSASSAAPGTGRSRRSTTAFPEPETPSLSFTMASTIRGRRLRMSLRAATRSSTVCRSSAPTGHRISSSSNMRRHPVFVPSGRSLGSAAYIGTPSVSATSRSRDVAL